MTIKYSLIIATLEDDGELCQCLDSLVRLEPGPPFEVIIVDQNGDDRLLSVISKYDKTLTIQHLQVPFQGASKARNFGAQLAQGKWLGFPDDDCQLLPDLLVQVDLLASTNSRVQVITGKTIDADGAANVLRWGTQSKAFSRWTMFGCLTEATLFVQREIFLTTNGFDERFGPGAQFPAAEGIDLMNRLFVEMGNDLAIYSPAIRMQHPTKIPPWNLWAAKRFQAYAKGNGALIAKSFQPHMVYWGLRTAGGAFIHILSLQGWKSLAYAARLLGLVTGFFSFYFRPRRR